MPKYQLIQKRVGETPLQALERLRATDPRLHGVPMTYAGRLDPMASGALLILIGDECKRRDAYTALDKTYEFEVLLGVSSDSGDVLGIVADGGAGVRSLHDVASVAAGLVGAQSMAYPQYSSKTVGGVPLFQYAIDGTVDSIDIPHKDVVVHSLSCAAVRTVSRNEMLTDVHRRIGIFRDLLGDRGAVNDFRLPAVVASWDALKGEAYQVVQCTAHVSSGTYIRQLACLMGERLGTSALAYSIHRSRISTAMGDQKVALQGGTKELPRVGGAEEY